MIVVPLSSIIPALLGFPWGRMACSLAEPVSNVIGGGLCFVTMLATVLPELRKIEEAQQ